MAMIKITGPELEAMVEHWLKTPVCGYLGSGYGQDIRALLQKPQSDREANALIRKLKADLLILTSLPPDAINLYGTPDGVDSYRIVLEVAGRRFNLSEIA